MAETAAQNEAFIARHQELEALDGLLDAAMSGGRAVCFVTGEAGAGKTALLAEFCRRTRRRYPDLVISDGRCDAQTGSGDPYLPFREILTELTGEADASSLAPGNTDTDSARAAHWFEAAKRTLTEHGPDLIDIFVPGGAVMTRLGTQAARRSRWGKRWRALQPADIDASRIDQTHICEQYTNVLRRLAARQPLVIIIDDLHWADTASIDLLFHLSRRLLDDPVFIVGAYRPEDVSAARPGERHPLEAVLNEIRRYHGDVEVAISTDDDTGARFIDELLDSEPNSLGPAFRTALFQHTGGHALFTVELLRHMAARGTLVRNEHGEWSADEALSWNDFPARVEGIVAERLARLDDAERELLSLAAVAGDSFLAEALAQSLELPLRAVVKSLSGGARDSGLVRPRGIQRIGGVRVSAYAFRHSLFQRYLYQLLDEIERTHMHETLAAALETLFAANPEVAALPLARHYAIAGIPDKALGYRLAAARQAYDAHAIDEAKGHLDQAIALLPKIGNDARTEAWARQMSLEIYRLRGWVFDRRCEYEHARESFETALESCDSDNRESRAMLLRAVATTFERQSRHEVAKRMLERSIEVLGPGPDEFSPRRMDEWLSTRVDQIWSAYWSGHSQLMSELIADVQPHIEAHGNPVQRRRFSSGKAMLGFREERYLLSGETVVAADEALSASRETDNLIEQTDALFAAGFARIFSDQPEAALDYLEEALRLAETCGDLRLRGRILTYLTVAYRLLGREERVARFNALASEAEGTSTSPDYVGVTLANRSWLAWRSGESGKAVDLAAEAIRTWEEGASRYPLQWLAKLHLVAIAVEQDDLDRAIELSRELLAPHNALLGHGVTDALAEALPLQVIDNRARLSELLHTALERARTAGYV